MTDKEAILSRHSIRKFTNVAIDTSLVVRLQAEIERINGLGKLHLQLVTEEPKAFKSFLSYGIFSNVSNYVMVIGRKSPTLKIRAGYYTESLVLIAQQLGLSTCIAGLTYKKISGQYELFPGETVLLCVAIGYAAEDGRKHRIKKPEQVSNITASTPSWFKNGVEAALLAPTAVNQQKFFFRFVEPENTNEKPGVCAIPRPSLIGYTQIDLGIAIRNFEIGAGKENFRWIDCPPEIL